MEGKVELKDLMEVDSEGESFLEAVKLLDGLDSSSEESTSSESSQAASFASGASTLSGNGVPGIVWVHSFGNGSCTVDI